MPVVIREIQSEDELKTIIGWAEDESWNPGKFDYKSYYALGGNESFLLLLVDDNPVGSISLVRYSDEHAFIGLFIVLPEYRRQGYGKRLWEAAMKRLEHLSTIGLYAVKPQISRYRRLSFFSTDVNHRWSLPQSKREETSPSSQHCELIEAEHEDIDSSDSEETSAWQQMISYDSLIWGSTRKKFFNMLLKQPLSFAFVTVDTETKQIKGYGVIRPCIDGFRIGPLYCDNFQAAQNLTKQLFSVIPERSQIIFDIPESNEFSDVFAEYFHLTPANQSDTHAMYKGEAHEGSRDRCYGVASLEIG